MLLFKSLCSLSSSLESVLFFFFCRHLVDTLNDVLMTAPETHSIRKKLSDLQTKVRTGNWNVSCFFLIFLENNVFKKNFFKKVKCKF